MSSIRYVANIEFKIGDSCQNKVRKWTPEHVVGPYHLVMYHDDFVSIAHNPGNSSNKLFVRLYTTAGLQSTLRIDVYWCVQYAYSFVQLKNIRLCGQK